MSEDTYNDLQELGKQTTEELLVDVAVKTITFKNLHLVAEGVLKNNPHVARGLMLELQAQLLDHDK